MWGDGSSHHMKNLSSTLVTIYAWKYPGLLPRPGLCIMLRQRSLYKPAQPFPAHRYQFLRKSSPYLYLGLLPTSVPWRTPFQTGAKRKGSIASSHQQGWAGWPRVRRKHDQTGLKRSDSQIMLCGGFGVNGGGIAQHGLKNGHSYSILHGTVWMWASLKAFVCVDIHSLVPLMTGAPPWHGFCRPRSDCSPLIIDNIGVT